MIIKFSDSRLYKRIRIFEYLETSQKKKILFLTMAQIFLGFLDLIAVGLVGALGSISAVYATSQTLGDRSTFLLTKLGIEGFAPTNQILILGIGAVSLFLIRTFLSMYILRRALFFLAGISAKNSKDLFSKMLADDMNSLQKFTSQEKLFALTNGMDSLFIKILGSWVIIAIDLSLLFILTGALLLIDFRTGILIISILVFSSYIFTLKLHSSSKAYGKSLSNIEIATSQLTIQTFSMYRELKVSGKRNLSLERFLNFRKESGKLSAELNYLSLYSKYAIESGVILIGFAVSSLLFVVYDSRHALGVFAILMATSTRIGPAFLRLQQSLLTIQTNLGMSVLATTFLDRYKNLSSIEDLMSQPKDADGSFEPKVQVIDCFFSYPENEKEALKGVSFTINPGEFVAIVGKTGSGKSTLLDLILGVIQPTSGKVLVSNYRSSEISERYPGKIGFVPQKIGNFSGDILQNISLEFLHSKIDNVQATKMAKEVGIHLEVLKLSAEYHSILGENGSGLSGGQNQKLGIARALYSNPELLIMDEATSALDSQSEFIITQNLKSMRGKNTLIIVAHRLSTVLEADKVLYFDEGKLLATGTFEEVRKAIPDFDSQASLMGL